MNPRYRRVLIPGLLTVLVVVVVLTSLARTAKGATGDGPASGITVSTITDPRVTESSGLALSVKHPGLAYTVNDSDNAPIVYAVSVSSGKVVGATTVTGGAVRDSEALAIDARGTLWIGDTGDNRFDRRDIALYSLPEPGPGIHTVKATRHPLHLPDGPRDIETLLIDPVSGAMFLADKSEDRGTLFAVTVHATETSVTAVARATMPNLATDGAFTPDGRFAVVRSYFSMNVYDAKTWRLVRSTVLPWQRQGETLVVEADGRSVLIGSEGRDSRLLRVRLDLSATDATSGPTPTAAPSRAGAAPETAVSVDDDRIWWYAVGGLVAVVAMGAMAVLRRR